MRTDHKANLVQALSEWLHNSRQEELMLWRDGTADELVAHSLANVLEAHIEGCKLNQELSDQ